MTTQTTKKKLCPKCGASTLVGGIYHEDREWMKWRGCTKCDWTNLTPEGARQRDHLRSTMHAR